MPSDRSARAPRPVRPRPRLRVVRGAGRVGRPTPSRAAAASLLVPGLGQLIQGRVGAGVVQVMLLAALYVGADRVRGFGVPPLAVLLALALASAADAVRGDRIARRAALRLVA